MILNDNSTSQIDKFITSNNNLGTFISKLGLPLSIDKSILLSIIYSSHNHYRSFQIPKRKGGYRVIDSPYPTLKYIQGLILNKYMADFSVDEYCFSFVKERNAIQHAKLHLNCHELLTLDIESFFSSITYKMVFEALIDNKIRPIEAKYISSICTLNGHLPQGACTSPVLSNIVFKSLDIRFTRLAKTLGLTYSRYADDLAFSGERVPRNIFKTIEKILQSKSFKLNKSKTKLKIEGARKIITGVSISSGRAKAPKSYKRSLRAQIYELEKNKDNLVNMKNFDPSIYEKTLGKLNYLLQIEPENNYALLKKETLLLDFKKFLMS